MSKYRPTPIVMFAFSILLRSIQSHCAEYFFEQEEDKICYSQCPPEFKYANQYRCVEKCPSSYYERVEGEEQHLFCIHQCSYYTDVDEQSFECVDQCPFPNALIIDQSLSNTLFKCSPTCQYSMFINRQTQQCEEQCEYRNVSLQQNKNIAICEQKNDPHFCVYLYQQLQDDFFICVDECSSEQLIYYNNTFPQCVDSCPDNMKYIQTNGQWCGAQCVSGYFSFNIQRNNPECITECDFPLTKIQNSSFNNYYQCESQCSVIFGSFQDTFLCYNQTCSQYCTYQNQTNSKQYYCETTINNQPSPNCIYQTAIPNTPNYVCSTICAQNLFVQNSNCVLSCLTNYFIAQSSQMVCTFPCVSSLYVSRANGNECVASCPSDHIYQNELECVASCTHFTNNSCTSCLFPLTISQQVCSTCTQHPDRQTQQCLQSCQYQNQSTGYCEAVGSIYCQYVLTSVENQNICVTSCQFYIQNNNYSQCVNSCPPNTYNDYGNCVSECTKIIEGQNCVSQCSSKNFAKNGVCVNKAQKIVPGVLIPFVIIIAVVGLILYRKYCTKKEVKKRKVQLRDVLSEIRQRDGSQEQKKRAQKFQQNEQQITQKSDMNVINNQKNENSQQNEDNNQQNNNQDQNDLEEMFDDIEKEQKMNENEENNTKPNKQSLIEVEEKIVIKERKQKQFNGENLIAAEQMKGVQRSVLIDITGK